MFTAIKFIFTKDRVLSELMEMKIINKGTRNEMSHIAGNPANIRYGVSFIKSGVAKNRFAAVAAVLARIAVTSFREDNDTPSTAQWVTASTHAMILAGASLEEAREIVKELMANEEKVLKKYGLD